MPDSSITKAELAEQLQLSRARISQLVKRGMPQREDGRIDERKALKWIEANTSSRGWTGRRKPTSTSQRARQTLDAGGALALYEHLQVCLFELPNLLIQGGMPLAEASAAVAVGQMLLAKWVGRFDPSLLSDIDLDQGDVAKLARAHGLQFDKDMAKRGDEVFARFYSLLGIRGDQQ